MRHIQGYTASKNITTAAAFHFSKVISPFASDSPMRRTHYQKGRTELQSNSNITASISRQGRSCKITQTCLRQSEQQERAEPDVDQQPGGVLRTDPAEAGGGHHGRHHRHQVLQHRRRDASAQLRRGKRTSEVVRTASEVCLSCSLGFCVTVHCLS